MPFQTGFLPGFKPIKLGTRFNKELHLHLFKLTHTEDKLTGNDFVTERLTNLSNTERYFHTTGLLHIQVIHENTLCRLWTEINLHRTVGSRTHFGSKHQVELTHFRPVLRTRNRTDDFLIQDNLTKFIQIIIIQCFCKTFVKRIAFSLMLQHTCIGAAELCFIKSFSKLFGGFGNFLVDFIIVFSQLVLNQNIGTIAFLRVAVVNQGVIESVNVSRCLPDSRVHKNCRIDTHDIFVQQHHALPPILFDVILQLHSHLTVIIDSTQSVINIT